MSSRYHEIYAAWKQDPEVFWGVAAREIDWYKPWDRVFDPYAGQYGRWFVGAECNTAYNCLDRHVERGRGRAEGADLRQPRHQDHACLHLRRAARRGGHARRRAAGPGRRQGRPRHHLHADGARGGDRHAGLRPHRRHPFGGVRRLCRAGAGNPHRRRQAGRHPLRLLRHRARPHRALQAAARRGHRARQAQAANRSDAAAADGRGVHDRRPRPRLGERDRRCQGARPQGRLRAGQGHRPALHPLHLRHDRPAQGRGARQRRAHGGAQVDHEEPLRRRARRDVLGRLRRRLGGRPFLHRATRRCCTAARRCCTRASRWARRTPAPSGASSPSTVSPPCSRRPPPSAPSRRRIPRASTSAATTCAPSARCSWPASAPIPRPSSGPRPTSRCRSTTTGGRRRPAGRSAAIRWAWARCPSSTARRRCRCRATTCRCSTPAGKPVKTGETGTLAIKLPLPPSCLPTLWNNDERFRNELPVGVSRLLHHRRTPATWTPTATST